jgi:S1-C subfamily serine protease
MTRLWTSASLALLTLATAPLAAQERDTVRERTRDSARERGLILERRPYTEGVRVAFGRQRIGVTVAMDTEGADGARLESVREGGPAAKAGLEAGDVITRFGDTRLSGESAGRRLVELAQRLEPGDTVKVEYTRDGRRREATIVAADIGGEFTFAMPSMERLGPALDQLRQHVQVFGYGMGGIHLQELGPELGEYFGTDKGALVLEPPADSTLPLRAGDVILAIDGREVQSASHAQRILASYAAGETVRFNVMRKRSRQTLEWKVPEERRWRGTAPRMVEPSVRGRARG